ncbi:MAG TPA: toxin-antitoxin system HicB family antitoxin [Rhabdochlamydiaceae bacterium]|nr:toxin-antitoxin system HicB family antitoxin [Rhabdochlamydiaceae bacterium]
MTHKQHHNHQKDETIRFTIDLPLKLHKYLKLLATREGVSLNEYVISNLPSLEKDKAKKKQAMKNWMFYLKNFS